MPSVLNILGRDLKYRWTFCMWQQQGPHPRMAMGIEVLWKPVVWFIKGSWPTGRGFVADGMEVIRDKSLHPWQQDLAWAKHCLKVVPKGGLVLDPMGGSMTVGIASIQAGYRFIGIEQDREALEVGTMRMIDHAKVIV
jgi:DNA modification methylase